MLDDDISELIRRKLNAEQEKKILQFHKTVGVLYAAQYSKGMYNSGLTVGLLIDLAVKELEQGSADYMHITFELYSTLNANSMTAETENDLKSVVLSRFDEEAESLKAFLITEEKKILDGDLESHTDRRFESETFRIKNHLMVEIDLKLTHLRNAFGQKAKEKQLIYEGQYVNPHRIEELKKLNSKDFSFVRLVRMCEELNNCFSNGNYFAVAAVLRTILNHVPLVFGFKTFEEVANNYSFGKSRKEIMKKLQEESRRISDYLLHHPIDKTNTLPNDTQVNFSQNLDILLEEVIKVAESSGT